MEALQKVVVERRDWIECAYVGFEIQTRAKFANVIGAQLFADDNLDSTRLTNW